METRPKWENKKKTKAKHQRLHSTYMNEWNELSFWFNHDQCERQTLITDSHPELTNWNLLKTISFSVLLVVLFCVCDTPSSTMLFHVSISSILLIVHAKHTIKKWEFRSKVQSAAHSIAPHRTAQLSTAHHNRTQYTEYPYICINILKYACAHTGNSYRIPSIATVVYALLLTIDFCYFCHGYSNYYSLARCLFCFGADRLRTYNS